MQEDITTRDIPNAWSRFLQDLELARNYPLTSNLSRLGGASVRNPLLEDLLPTYLYLRLISLLDEGLSTYIISEGLGSPKRPDLANRIELLSDQGRLGSAPDLHDLRTRRNSFAHTSQPTYLTWATLDEAVSTIETAFQLLGLVGIRPKYEIFGERSTARADPDPEVSIAWDFEVGLKMDGKRVISFSWSERLHDSKS